MEQNKNKTKMKLTALGLFGILRIISIMPDVHMYSAIASQINRGVAVNYKAGYACSELKSRAEEAFNKRGLARILSECQVIAIQKAHSYGKGHLGKMHSDGTYAFSEGTYSLSDIKMKDKILISAGFNHSEIKALMDYGIAGNKNTMGGE